jgi:phospholipid/cholesterol/gamma-HCH transport system permease protein
MGLVLTLQRPTLAKFGAESWLGMVALSLIREIAPVITALICAGKVSSGIGAELGSMKVTEQIDAMEVAAINPFKYLVVTRILATTLMVPLLVIFADGVGMLGGFIGINMTSVFSLHLKGFRFFGIHRHHPGDNQNVLLWFFIGMIGCYKGFNAENGTASVGQAANSAVVTASLTILSLIC